jgi:CrcB protein
MVSVESDRPRVIRPWQPRLAHYTAVGIGGLLGANARYQVGEWIASRWSTAFPWGTLLINVSGSFVLSLFLTLTAERFSVRPTTRLFVATGFLGGYTTFSTFSYEAVRLLQRGHPTRAMLYVAASLIAGIAAVVAGIVVARVVLASVPYRPRRGEGKPPEATRS